MTDGSSRRAPATRYAWLAGAALMCAGFIALGCWQLARLQWKLDLIAHVDQRVHAAATDVPSPAAWPQLNASSDEYRHLRASGIWLDTLNTRVQAATDLGSGFWLLTPLCQADGSVVLVNRGFVKAEAGDWKPSAPQQAADHACAPHDPLQNTASVTGLLRISEPGGGFLRHNDATANRWFSRDVAAIAAAHALARTAPYFIDADAAPSAGADGQPVGGLTVISFHNNHMVYALTWFALAAMAAGAALLMTREWKRKDGVSN